MQHLGSMDIRQQIETVYIVNSASCSNFNLSGATRYSKLNSESKSLFTRLHSFHRPVQYKHSNLQYHKIVHKCREKKAETQSFPYHIIS